jgi:phosphate uptake regulator
MESRKVQRVGYATFSVSLPKDWVESTGLKQGDLIMVFPEKDGSLKLIPSSMVERKAQIEEYVINSDLCTEPRMLERIIVGNYILGRDVFKVISSTRIGTMHAEEVRQITRRLMGLGIVQETPQQIDLQCSIDPTKFKIDMLLRRLSIIASTMNSEAMQALTESNQEMAEATFRLEDEADMMYWLATRLLISAQHDRIIADKVGLEEPSQILYYTLIARYLEIIADHAEDIARRVIEFKNHIKERANRQAMRKIINLSEMAQSVLLKAMDCLFNGNIENANNVLEITKVIRNEHERLMEELPESEILRTVVLDLRRIADNGAGIAVIAINRALEKPSKICYVENSEFQRNVANETS